MNKILTNWTNDKKQSYDFVLDNLKASVTGLSKTDETDNKEALVKHIHDVISEIDERMEGLEYEAITLQVEHPETSRKAHKEFKARKEAAHHE